MEIAFFGAIARSGVRALLMGRRALVVLGLPVLTADYDFWIDIEHIFWFRRRYPKPADRLAYVRRAHARWLRSRDRE